uniref:Uncharacterized protein n=1 Tax=Saccharolobus islandicus TaxID=43080 RepID=Q5W2T7_SACIS|nr:hypothetical protein [Sulfolobus islandicus]CAG38209.1 hypothetical protein [Sulfolobus islandicus]
MIRVHVTWDLPTDKNTYLELGKVLAEQLKYCTQIIAADDEGIYLECAEIPEEVRQMKLKYVKVWGDGEEE